MKTVQATVAPAWGRHFEFFVAPTVSGRTATFENGATLAVGADGTVELVWPDGKMAIRRLAVPAVTFADGTRAVWSFRDVSLDSNCAVVSYTAPGGRVLNWSFKAGHLNLDGRKYLGIAESVRIGTGVRQVCVRGEIVPGSPLRMRRLSVSGGAETFDLADGKSGDAGRWKPFADGQPFTYAVGTNGVYAGMPVGIDDLTVGTVRPTGAEGVVETREVAFGPDQAETQFWWHWYAPGAENGNNDYLARLQYVRQFLRRRYGLREWPAAPGMQFELDSGEASYARLADYRRIQAGGSRIVSPGMNPLLLDGADFGARDMRDGVFALAGGAPSAVGGADALTLAAYGCFPRTGAALPADAAAKFAEALKLCVMPFVRETPFGTTWTGKDGGLIVFLRDAEEVDVTLPKAWTIRGVDGGNLRNVKAGTVYFVESHEFDR